MLFGKILPSAIRILLDSSSESCFYVIHSYTNCGLLIHNILKRLVDALCKLSHLRLDLIPYTTELWQNLFFGSFESIGIVKADV